MNIKEIEKDIVQTDENILLYAPHIYQRYGKNITVKQINYYYKWEKFVYLIGVFFKYYYLVCENSKLPDRLSDIGEFRNNVQLTIGANKLALKALIKICKFCEIHDEKKNVKMKWKTRWMKKTFTLDDWVELFVKIYLYNIKGVKKNLYEGLVLLSKAQLN